jgi:hypothetical protein
MEDCPLYIVVLLHAPFGYLARKDQRGQLTVRCIYNIQSSIHMENYIFDIYADMYSPLCAVFIEKRG